MMIKAAIFDMDGLLIDSEPFWQAAQRTAFKTVGIELTQADLDRHMGRRISENIEEVYHKRPWQGASQKDIEALIIDEVIASIKREGQPRPGVKPALELCKNNHLPLALASSSSNEIISAVLDTLGIKSYFDYIYSADNEPYGKPHPGVFITAAGLLKVPPRDCLVFEDAPSGVLAAKAAKMKCIAVPAANLKDDRFVQTADVVLDSLEEFDLAMLKRL